MSTLTFFFKLDPKYAFHLYKTELSFPNSCNFTSVKKWTQ